MYVNDIKKCIESLVHISLAVISSGSSIELWFNTVY